MMWWARIGRVSVWFLAYTAAYVIMRIVDLEMGDVNALSVYRATVHLGVGMALGYLILWRGF